MKKFTLISCMILFLFSNSIGQTNKQISYPISKTKNPGTVLMPGNANKVNAQIVCPDDSAYTAYLDRATGYVFYNSTTGGYVIGTNDYGDTEKGVHFDFSGSSYVTGVFIWFGGKMKIGTADTYELKLYNTGADSLPTGAALATETFTTDDVDTVGSNFTYIEFKNPAIISGRFAIGVEVDNATADDTIGIVSSKNGDGLGEKRGWEQWSNGTITSITGGWGLDLDPMIIPVVSSSYVMVDFGKDTTVNSGSNVTFTANVIGTNSPYTYLWSTGATTSSITISPAQSDSLEVIVTNSIGCQAEDSIYLTVITCSVTADAGANESICPGETKELKATGGVSYSWSPTIGLSNPNIQNPTASPSVQMTYYVEVTDSLGCKGTDSVTVAVNAIPSMVVVSTTDAACGASNGSVTISAFGSTAPYTYSWSNGSTTNSISNVAAGTYKVTISDSKGCKYKPSVGVNNIGAPTVLVTNSTNSTCFGSNDGTALISVSGGSTPYSYMWSNGVTTKNVTNLPKGINIIQVSDSVNCISTASVTITEPSELIIITTKVNASCTNDDGTVTNNVSGGTLPYLYKWSNGSTTNNITGLSVGNYTITVIDANSCKAISTTNIQSDAGIVTNVLTTNVKCNGNSDGIATANTTGGTTPYSYSWSDGSASSNLTNLAVGSYTVTTTDSLGCKSTVTVIITQPNVLAVSVTSTPNTGTGNSGNGSVTANVTGGTAPYVYAWSNGGNGSSLSNLAGGNYNINITDANGCTANGTTTVGGPGVGIKENMLIVSDLLLYPNPTYGKIILKVNLNLSQELNINIYNMLGNLITTIESNNKGSSGTYMVDLSNQKPGLYFVRIQSSDKVITQKITLIK